MKLTRRLLEELQNRLKIGNRRSVHLNAIPSRSRYKFDFTRLSYIDNTIPDRFINTLLSEKPLKFRISWKDNVPDLNSLLEEDQFQLVSITKSFENLINQTEVIESEKGINTFGFGFPLLARRDQSDNKLTVAPILIWSLKIVRTREFNTWEIQRNEDDPIYINEILINHLQNDSKIEISQIPDELLQDGLIDEEELLDICTDIIKSINSSVPENIREIFNKKLHNLKKIPDKNHFEKLPLSSNNSVIDFSGLFSIFEAQKQSIIQDYDRLLDLEGSTIDLDEFEQYTFQPISSVETDPSQQEILHSLNSSRNILIQGPPGTGKSQSLTAILINALENHKKTIVVCEKRTALEVLHNALCERSLKYYCVLIKDIIKDRRTVVDSVRDRLDNSSSRSDGYPHSHSKGDLDKIITKAKRIIESINYKHHKLGEKVIGDKNWTRIVGELLHELRDNYEDYEISIDKDLLEYSDKELTKLIDLIEHGQILFNEYNQFRKYSFINPSKFIGDNPYIIEEQLENDFRHYEKELQSILSDILKFENEYSAIRKSQFEFQTNIILNIVNQITELLKRQVRNPEFFNEDLTSKVIYKISSIFNAHRSYVLENQKRFNALYTQLISELNKCKDLKFEYLPVKTICEKQKTLELISDNISTASNRFDLNIIKELEVLNLFGELDQDYKSITTDSIKKKILTLREKINEDSWPIEPINDSSHKEIVSYIRSLITKKKAYFNTDYDLFLAEFKWYNYYDHLSESYKLIIEELKTKTNWRKVFLLFYLNSLLTRFASKDIPTNDNEYEELDNSLIGHENEQIKYIKEYWYSCQIDTSREFDIRNPYLSVANLYNKRSSHKHKRLSLRKIVKYDTDIFTTFFPVILTTPDVCSNLFKGNDKYFDIVLFDEASQLKLEDNLPALLKGKQIVIAGDEHQMPPSNYFSKIFDGSIDDEVDYEEEEVYVDRDDILLSCESLLEFATELNFERKYLDFHYRSRHPYLIDFSNHAFYNQRLKPMPNGFAYNPIKYIQVNGTYSDHSNELEAEMVLSILENNIQRFPNGKYPSVGIATFNISQRNLIYSKINDRRKFEKYQDFNDKLTELEDNGLFIKNLENIQGDERDVIILSTTYGINKDGSFAQRFGPINHSKGYKLLNVIITRAKYKIYVCSSVPENVFLNYKDFLITEGANNRRAILYSYLAYAKAVSEKDETSRLSVLSALTENSSKQSRFMTVDEDLESPFEEEVYLALLKHLDESKLRKQVQFAGFRIDIVYDPKIKGIPRIAIECDGAKYHSSQEAYLYDKHRQKILERNGFIFHRIWSTNWWRNPVSETKRLVEFIHEVEVKKPSLMIDGTEFAQTFKDDGPIILKRPLYATSTTQADLKDHIEAVEDEIPDYVEECTEVVKLHSKVKVKYLNNGIDLVVCLTKNENIRYNKTNGIQNIYINSPLAVSLLGRKVGDTVKVGKLDNYVEIIEIFN